VAYQLQTENLQKELERLQKEVTQLKADIQVDKIKFAITTKDIEEEFRLSLAEKSTAKSETNRHCCKELYGDLIGKVQWTR
jgi:hypothetical protein